MGTVSGRAPHLRHAGLVAIGGAAGTTARALLSEAAPAAAEGVPWMTFTINIVGSFVLGLLLESLLLGGPDEGRRRSVRLLVGTGVLGGFTTYSTFVLEIERRLVGGAAAVAAGYAAASVVLGVAAAAIGIVCARGALRRRASGGDA